MIQQYQPSTSSCTCLSSFPSRTQFAQNSATLWSDDSHFRHSVEINSCNNLWLLFSDTFAMGLLGDWVNRVMSVFKPFRVLLKIIQILYGIFYRILRSWKGEKSALKNRLGVFLKQVRDATAQVNYRANQFCAIPAFLHIKHFKSSSDLIWKAHLHPIFPRPILKHEPSKGHTKSWSKPLVHLQFGIQIICHSQFQQFRVISTIQLIALIYSWLTAPTLIKS